jgi:methionine-rich copper-binding protein CopC
MRKIVLAVIALMLVPVSANAHAGLVSATPAANSEVNVMPLSIALTFTEDLLTIGDKEVNTISLTNPEGDQISLGDIAVAGPLLTAAIPEAEYPSGAYTVEYKIVSADGHQLSDSYSFSLNGPTLYTAPAPAAEDGDGVLPLPIVGAIAIVILLGGFYALRARNRRK